MDKAKNTFIIKLSEDDIRQAVEDYMNKKTMHDKHECIKINKTRSKKWFLIAECK